MTTLLLLTALANMSCKGHALWDNKDLAVTLYDGAHPVVSVNGAEQAVTAVAERKIENADKLVLCSDDDQKCIDQYIPPALVGTPSGALLQYLMMIHSYQTDPEMQGHFQTDLDYAKIASGKVYALGESSQYGLPGIYEYYDAKDKLLERFLVRGVEVIVCR